jgi:hypothetical protein
MVLAFSFHMSHTLPILHCVLLLVTPLGAFLMRTLLFHIYGTAKPFQVSRPKAVVYVRNKKGLSELWRQKYQVLAGKLSLATPLRPL